MTGNNITLAFISYPQQSGSSIVGSSKVGILKSRVLKSRDPQKSGPQKSGPQKSRPQKSGSRPHNPHLEKHGKLPGKRGIHRNHQGCAERKIFS